jgi:HTH-type transcriptional regulator/antitoxin HigA
MSKVKEKKGYKTMPSSYEELTSKYPIKPIKTEAENDHYLRVYEELTDFYIDNPDVEFLGDYLEALSIFIEKFEKQAYPIPETTGVDALRFLMRQHELKQKDLLDIFKTPSILSEVLSGKRQFTLEHVKLLSAKFGVSSDIFIT